MADHDHQKVIELDANKQVDILFEVCDDVPFEK